MSVDLGLLFGTLGTLVGGGGIGALVKIIMERRDGTEARKVAEVERIRKLYAEETARADAAEKKARILAVYANDLQIFAMKACGVPSSEIPPWPEY